MPENLLKYRVLNDGFSNFCISDDFKSPNFGPRDQKPIFIIIHYTQMNCNEALERLCDVASAVSAHYFIRSDGLIFRLVEEENTAWHAGVSYFAGYEKLNRYSIGIELDNLGYNPYPNAQMDSLVFLCKLIKERYNIQNRFILGHSDIAPNRKIDPGYLFNWEYLAKKDIGIWAFPEIKKDCISQYVKHQSQSPKNKHDAQYPSCITNYDLVDSVYIKTLQQKLADFGYKIDVNGLFDQETEYVIRAFQMHYVQSLFAREDFRMHMDNQVRYKWNKLSDETLDFFNLMHKLS